MDIKAMKILFDANGYILTRSKKNTRKYDVVTASGSEVIHGNVSEEVILQMAHTLDATLPTPIVVATKQRSAKVKKSSPKKPASSMMAKALVERKAKVEANGGKQIIHLADEQATDGIVGLDYDVKIPTQIDGYYFPSITKAILPRVAINRNVWLNGPAGSGKSQFVVHLAKLIGQKVIRVNFSVGTTEQHLIGRWNVKNGETVFNYGVLPMAMQNGWWILFDEMDYAMPEHLAILQPVLEGESLIVTQHNGEEIIPHLNFRIFATGNTKGRGDESQSYVGTNNLNMAFLDRWSIFSMDYTNKEEHIVNNIIGDEKLSADIVKYFSLLRKASEDGAIINSAFSTRRLIMLAEALKLGDSLKEALENEVYTRYEKHEVSIMREISYDVWSKDVYLKSWHLGDKHVVQNQSTVDSTIVQAGANARDSF